MTPYIRGTLVALAATFAVSAHAAESYSNADLGKDLTPVGAIKAGNADGSIPAWDGGLCKPVAGYKPIDKSGTGYPMVDPFADEKPLFTITAQNLSQYADKIEEGSKVLFKRFPDSYRMHVYPTHRTACYPDWVYDNTVKGAGQAKLEAGGIAVSNTHARVPFPVPQNGYEVMWNTLLRFGFPYVKYQNYSVLSDAAGRPTVTASLWGMFRNYYWDTKLTQVEPGQPYEVILNVNEGPPSQAGVKQLRLSVMRPDVKDPSAYSYVPGQRRVRLAPEFKYDTVSTNSGGVLLFDEINGFDGKMDKFDFKLVGRKELYVLYNGYKFESSDARIAAIKAHIDPEYLRWELHRVWVVEADLKPGQRHVEKKKVFFLDEDAWTVAAYYGLDKADQVYHYQHFNGHQEYDKPSFRSQHYTLYDFSKGIYINSAHQGGPSPQGGLQFGAARLDNVPESTFKPDAMAGSGVR